MSQKCMAVYLTVSEILRQKWTGGSFYPPLAGIRDIVFLEIRANTTHTPTYLDRIIKLSNNIFRILHFKLITTPLFLSRHAFLYRTNLVF